MNKEITSEIAEQILNFEPVQLDEFNSISDLAAEALAKDGGFELELNCLTSLSDAAAISFGKYEGVLSLNRLTSISDSAAESLRKCKGDLNLDGLTSLSDTAAESLRKRWLSFSWWFDISIRCCCRKFWKT